MKTFIKATTVPSQAEGIIDDNAIDNAHTWSAEKIKKTVSPVRVTLQKTGNGNSDVFFSFTEIENEAKSLGKDNLCMIIPEGARPLETWDSYPSTIFYFPNNESWAIRVIGSVSQRFEITFLVL